MADVICMFNHKGGVSKTTTAYGLGWMLAQKGKRVILVDADSQCNLSAIALGEDNFEQLYLDHPERNIKTALSPAFDAKPMLLQPVECTAVKNQPGLFLLPGSFDLSEYEVSLGVSFTLTDTMLTLRNLPGSFSYLIHCTAQRYNADYVIVDMNPSLSAINEALLVSSDYFIVPAAPDYFSVLAIRSLAKILPRWEKWATRARDVFSDASYPLPRTTPRFLGTIVQGFNIRRGQPTQANQRAISRISDVVKTTLITSLREVDMVLSDEYYTDETYCLASIPDFQSLNAAFHATGIPVFALSDDQLGFVGTVLQQYKETRSKFENIFSNFAERVIAMTSI